MIIGNGSPWAHEKRSPAGGDNLCLASLVALNPDTGEYVWHYQQTPGDNWDFTSTQPMILADLKIGCEARKLILHAPKNGFFFVVDRKTGEFISAKNVVDVNWASGYDAKGRPIETAIARVADRPREIIPSAHGPRNWQSMSFNPQTGLVYMPVQNVPVPLLDNKDWKFNAEGRFIACDARNGKKRWEAPTGTGVIAAPSTYLVDGIVQGVPYNKDHVAEGIALCVSNCVFCHGVPGVDRGGNIPNLGYSSQAVVSNLEQYMFGALARNGMPDFMGKLQPADVDKLKAFIQGTADAVRPKEGAGTGRPGGRPLGWPPPSLGAAAQLPAAAPVDPNPS